MALECDEIFKPDPKLPPITTQGKNTFGCMINGKLWLPKGASSDGLSAVNQIPERLALGAYSRENDPINITIILKGDFNVKKVYDLTDINEAELIVVSPKSCKYSTEIISGNVEMIKYDRKEMIVAGAFEFTIYNANCGDTLKVTDGRFDLHLVL